jgi:hypothetical protein
MPRPEYFELFPTVPYTFSPTPENDIHLVTNIFTRVRFRQVIKDFSVIFGDYFVEEGDTPEILASKVWGDAKYHYIVLLANDIYNVYTQWPLPYGSFIASLQKKYSFLLPIKNDISILQKRDWALSELSATNPCPVHSFYNWKNRQIDFSTYQTDFLNNTSDKKPYYLTYYEYEEQENERKRKIVLPNSNYVPRIHSQMIELMNQ